MIFLLTALSAIPVLVAAEIKDDVPLTFDRLDLTDGRVLRNVVVKTYDAKSAELLLIANGKAMSVPIALVPPPFNAKLKRAPESGGGVSIITEPRPVHRPIAHASDQYGLLVPPRAPATGAQRITREDFQRTNAAKAPVTPAIDFAQHQLAARSRAERYFRYEHRAGSGSIIVTQLELEMGVLVPVPGWDGRCRTEGKAYFGFYDSRGGSFQRGTSSFEVTTEKSITEGIRIVDFSRKN